MFCPLNTTGQIECGQHPIEYVGFVSYRVVYIWCVPKLGNIFMSPMLKKKEKRKKFFVEAGTEV